MNVYKTYTNAFLLIFSLGIMTASVMAGGLFSEEDNKYRKPSHSTRTHVVKRRLPTVIPGLGGGPVTIGTSYQKVVAYLGRPTTKESYQQIYDRYVKFGINPKKNVEFNLKFDFIARYRRLPGRVPYPVFTIFFRNDKIAMLSYSVFPYKRRQVNKVVFQLPGKPGFRFFGSTASVRRALGRGAFSYPDRKYYNHEYLADGITVMTQYNKRLRRSEVVTVKIYPPMTTKNKIAYKNNFRRKQRSKSVNFNAPSSNIQAPGSSVNSNSL